MMPSLSTNLLHWLVLVILMTGRVCFSGQAVHFVTNTNDMGPGSLRQAILDANASGGGTLLFSKVTSVIQVKSALPPMTNIVLQGPGASVRSIRWDFGFGNSETPMVIPAGSSCSLEGLWFGGASNAKQGGMIRNEGTLFVKDCMMSDVWRSEVPGQGIAIYSAGDLVVESSTFFNLRDEPVGRDFTGNYICVPDAAGAAVHVAAGTLAMTNVTISSVGYYPPIACTSKGGAIYANPDSSVRLHHCTLANNHADEGWTFYGPIQTENCLVVDGSWTGIERIGNNLFAESFSLAGITSLGDHGGATLTHALLNGSPAMEQGNPSVAPAFDQRGVARPQGAQVDIGAVETVWPDNAVVLSVSTNGMGMVHRSLAATFYESNATVTLQAIADEDHAFTGWSEDASGSTNPLVLRLDGNKHVTANFVYAPATVISPPGSTQIVVNAASWGPGSLRQAIRNLNASGGGTIRFADVTGTLAVGTNLPVIEADTAIQGSYGGDVRLRWTNASSSFFVFAPGTTNRMMDVAVDLVPPPHDSIFNQGRLDLVRVALNGSVVNEGTMTMAGSVALGGRIVNQGTGNFTAMRSRLSGRRDEAPGLSSLRHRAKLIQSGGTMRLESCQIVDFSGSETNRTRGGAMFIEWGHLELVDCMVTNNGAYGQTTRPGLGGALYVAGGEVWLSNSVFGGNKAQGGFGRVSGGPQDNRFNQPGGEAYGGAIHLEQGFLVADGCSFVNNLAVGGGSPEGCLLVGVFIPAQAYGGAISGELGECDLRNCTLSGNTTVAAHGGTCGSDCTAGGTSMGGALFMDEGAWRITSCTIVSNTAMSGRGQSCTFNGTLPAGHGLGGGLFNANAHLILNNSIVALNLGAQPDTNTMGVLLSTNAIPFANDLVGVVHGGGHNLFGSVEDRLAVGDILAANPLLGPLQDNGGFGHTHALLVGSPALDAGVALELTEDGRGRPRTRNQPGIPDGPGGDGTDIGALEVEPDLVLTGIRHDAGAVFIGFTTVSDRTYGVEFKERLTDPSWLALPDLLPGTGGIISHVVTNDVLRPARFFRVFVRQPR